MLETFLKFLYEESHLPNLTEFQISGITIAAMLFNVVMRKSESSGKADIQIIKNQIQALYLNIKGIDIDHCNENINSMTTALAAPGMIMTYIMHHLFKAYNVCDESEFR